MRPPRARPNSGIVIEMPLRFGFVQEVRVFLRPRIAPAPNANIEAAVDANPRHPRSVVDELGRAGGAVGNIRPPTDGIYSPSVCFPAPPDRNSMSPGFAVGASGDGTPWHQAVPDGDGLVTDSEFSGGNLDQRAPQRREIEYGIREFFAGQADRRRKIDRVVLAESCPFQSSGCMSAVHFS